MNVCERVFAQYGFERTFELLCRQDFIDHDLRQSKSMHKKYARGGPTRTHIKTLHSLRLEAIGQPKIGL